MENIKKYAYNTLVICLIAIGAIIVIMNFSHFGNVEFTDNARVRQHVTPQNTRVQGFIKEVRFEEFQHVKKGDTLVVIEDAEFRLQLAQAEAAVKGQHSGSSAVSASMNTVENNVMVAAAGMRVATAGISEAKEGMDNAKKDYDRFAALLKKGAVTQQQFDNVKTQYEQAVSRYRAAQARLSQASASRQATAVVNNEQKHRLGQSRAGESVAEAQLHLARLNLSYCYIIASCDGVVGTKDIQEGMLVQPGQTLVNIVDANSIWVEANYKESQLPNIHEGAEVEMKADAVPGVKYKGHVERISSATGSAFSLLPIDNATGNFVKVEQRVSVRIMFDGNKPEDMKKLRAGYNLECEVKY